MSPNAKARRAAIYLRVSTDSQTVDNQRRELRAVAERNGWTVVQEFADKGISGAKGRADRPQLDAMLKGVARRDFDIVAAWSVDRLGRSLQDLVAMLGEFHAKGVDLFLHQQGIDTTTPGGKAMFQMCGVFAEFERSMIRARIAAGIKRARAKGDVVFGRPKTDEKVEVRIRRSLAEGNGIIKTARALGVGVSVVQRIKAETAAPAPARNKAAA
jgi:DNA invertase Pin-like site-specific DNA recombinase